MTADEPMLTCYNPGCQDKKYLASQNSDSSCRFHPNMPIFHDGIKRWPCCKKSSCDFSTLLSYPGCIQGPHNPDKPEPPAVDKSKEEETAKNGEESAKADTSKVMEQLFASQQAPKPQEIISVDRNPSEPMVKLPVKVMPSLTNALAKLSSEPIKLSSGDETLKINDPTQILTCENFGCSVKITRSEMDSKNWQLVEDCLHHPKPPVFHEGLQYWGCCQKKHTDFEKMRNQPGCSNGYHKWTKGISKAKCRFDHFDNPALLTLNIYAKNSDPGACEFEANSCRLRVRIVYGVDRQQFQKDFDLFSTVDVSKCSVNLNATKVEVKLSKSPMQSWKAVEQIPPPPTPPVPSES